MLLDLNTKLFILFLIFYASTTFTNCTVPKWNYYKNGEDWPMSCQKGLQAPIDVVAPFKYKKLNLTFFYSKMNTEYTLYNNGNNLILEGDFGYIIYNNITYFSTEAIFFSPSTHKIANRTFPLEMQIIHNDKTGSQIVISVFFKESTDYSILLGQLGFDKIRLREQIPFELDIIHENVDLSRYISNKKDFIYYHAHESAPPCKADSTYLIMTDIYKVTKDQLKNFPKVIKGKTREIQEKKGRKIYASFRVKEILKKKKLLKNKLKKIKDIQNSRNNLENIDKNIEKKKIIKTSANITNTNSTNGTKQKQNNATKKLNQTDKNKSSMNKLNNKMKKDSKNDTKHSNKTKKISNDGKSNSTEKALNQSINGKNITNNTNSSNSDVEVFHEPCVEIVPFNIIKNRAIGLSKIKKFKQPAFFVVPRKPNETMILDYDLPKSNAEIMSMNLEEKQKYLHHLYKKSVLSPGDPFIFLQIKKIETLLNEGQLYEDFSSFFVMDEMILGGGDDMNDFLQIKSKQEKKVTNVNKNEVIKAESPQAVKIDTLQQTQENSEKKNDVVTKVNEQLSQFDKSEPKLEDQKTKDIKELQSNLQSVKKMINYQQNKVNYVKDQLKYKNMDYKEDLKKLMNKNKQKNKAFTKLRKELMKDSDFARLARSQKTIFKNLRNIHSQIHDNIKKVNPVLSEKKNSTNSSCKLKKVNQTEIMKSYNYLKNIDKGVYILFKLIIIRLYKEFRKLDKLNELNPDNLLINSQGYIRITHENLALILKKAYELERDKKQDFSVKLENLYELSRKVLLSQNLHLKENPENDVSKVSVEDISEIISIIFQKNIVNKSTFKPSEKKKVKNLVVEIIESLPISLTTKALYKKSYLGGDNTSQQPKGSLIIDKSNPDTKLLNKFLEKKEKKELNEKSPIGEGRKPRSKSGKIDRTDLWDITTWPDQCKTNKMQSPININYPYDPEILLFSGNYRIPKGKIEFLNDGFKLILRAKLGGFQYGIHKYVAKEVHFHYPSEHTFGEDETRSPLEMQIIHEDVFGNIAAVSVLFQLSLNNNKFLQELGFGVDDPNFALKLRNNEVMRIQATSNLNLGANLNEVSHYVHYTGSMTTPPCNPNVEWFVLLDKLDVSQQQLNYFPVLFGLNSNVRGLQPLGDRVPKII